MPNVKNEILEIVNEKEILCAIITESILNSGLSPNESTGKLDGICLKEGYSGQDFQDFLSQLDYEYHNGYGRYAIGGTIWLKDGSWIERCEYDGETEWVERKLPSIPPQLRSIN